MNRAALHVPDQAGTGPWRVDAGLVVCASALILVGLVMVASASISIADGKFESPLHFFWRQSAGARGRARMRRGGGDDRSALLATVRDHGPLRRYRRPQRGADSGPRTPGERRRAVARPRPRHLSPGRGDEARVRRLPGRLSRAAGREGSGCTVDMRSFRSRSSASSACCFSPSPDFGTVVVLGLTLLGMLFIAGVPFHTFVAWSGALAIALAVLAVAEPYRIRRLLTFPRSVRRPVRRRIPARPGPDRDRTRRVVRRRTRRERAEALLPSGRAHGLPVRGRSARSWDSSEWRR